MKPTYKHDCDNCIFVGRWNNDAGMHDLYACHYTDEHGHHRNVIARYGDDGPNYLSGITFASNSWVNLHMSKGYEVSPLRWALASAVAKGIPGYTKEMLNAEDLNVSGNPVEVRK